MPLQSWSDKPIEPFKVKFFLDTNILCDLVCNTYSGLNTTIKWLNECQFANLVSSKYVLFEFIDVRKKTIYLAEVNRLTAKNKILDPNVIVRNKEHFENPSLDFHQFKEQIKNQIEQEQQIFLDLDVKCDETILHDNLLKPTKDINLYSKVSREDSLISVSSVWKDSSLREDFLVFLTRDKAFADSFSEVDLAFIFSNYGLIPPHIKHVRDITLATGTRVNLTDSNDDAKLPTFLPTKLKELILSKNQSLFLGKTFPPSGANFPNDAICFRLQPNTSLDQNIYLTIIGKDLDFIYSVKCPVSNFFNNSPIPIAAYPFTNAAETNIAFTPKDDSTGSPLSLDVAIITKFREEGNLVFINPDGMI